MDKVAKKAQDRILFICFQAVTYVTEAYPSPDKFVLSITLSGWLQNVIGGYGEIRYRLRSHAFRMPKKAANAFTKPFRRHAESLYAAATLFYALIELVYYCAGEGDIKNKRE
ncbi:hypothetical protein CVT25_008591 [Psilocybe cyanescens]|uniref:Uncharacterized protein n=1 Tax=Psilocybe cyanescens TaxID=93625 RepID=A0A409XNH8_PSICY|nr:hypothetical protein CVT25_008591 [Psilocybe cyanescens]